MKLVWTGGDAVFLIVSFYRTTRNDFFKPRLSSILIEFDGTVQIFYFNKKKERTRLIRARNNKNNQYWRKF